MLVTPAVSLQICLRDVRPFVFESAPDSVPAKSDNSDIFLYFFGDRPDEAVPEVMAIRRNDWVCFNTIKVNVIFFMMVLPVFVVVSQVKTFSLRLHNRCKIFNSRHQLEARLDGVFGRLIERVTLTAVG